MSNKNKITKESLKDKIEGNELDLSLSGLTKVPVKEIASITKIKCVDLSCNQLASLPDNFSVHLSHLTRLDLSKNLLESLPQNFGLMVALQHLDLLGNKLTDLPLSFGDLKGLRWLDLKENPLEPNLNKIVGDCLDDKQCKACAQKVVGRMQSIQDVLEQQRLKIEAREKMREGQREASKQEEKRRMREGQREASKREKEAKQRELKKRKKQEEKELRRREYEAAQEAKKQAEMEEEEERVISQEHSQANGDAGSYEKTTKTSGSSCLMIFFSLLIVLVAVAVGSYFYCESNPSLPACVTAHQTWDQASVEIQRVRRDIEQRWQNLQS